MATPPTPDIVINENTSCNNILSGNWKNTRIGADISQGCVDITENSITVTASGNGIGSSQDAFQYVYQSLIGDGEIIAKLDNIEQNDSIALAGIMVRDGLNKGSKFLMIGKSDELGFIYSFREVLDATPALLSISAAKNSSWMKIKKAGNKYTIYHSEDGESWSRIVSKTFDLGDAIYIGLPVTSSNNNANCTAYFSDVSIKGNTGGGINVDYWKNITGSTINDLKNSSVYPGSPDTSLLLDKIEIPVFNEIDNYGLRLRGYLNPPVTGNYVFNISANENAQLLLSTDTSVNNSDEIAFVENLVLPDEWDKYASQQSDSIFLEAGKLYYMEVLHKASIGDDHLRVAWTVPGEELQIIDGKYISPYAIKTTTSIKDFNQIVSNKLYEVYPNPADDIINIRFLENINSDALVEIYSLSGQKVFQKISFKNFDQVNVSMLNSGLYILMITKNDIKQYTKIRVE
jgi:regulation of enolase protein 1 (concanavalin A-like superfamily)